MDIHPNKSPQSAITLIELMVAIAVLAILVAMVLSFTRYTKESARASQCITKMRQIGISTQLYIADHNGLLPMRPQDNPPARNWMVHLAPYLGVPEPAITGIIPESDIYLCPDDPSFQPRQTRTYRYTQTFPGPSNPGYPGNYTPSRFREIANPSRHSMFVCIAYTGTRKLNLWSFDEAAWNMTADSKIPPEGTSSWIRPHYNGQAMNVLFSDGHIEKISFPSPASMWYFTES